MIRKYRHFFQRLGYVILLQLFFLPQESHAQKLELTFNGIPKDVKLPAKRADSSALKKVSNRVIQNMRANGYWMANLDSLVVQNHRANFYFDSVRRFQKVIVSLKDESGTLLHESDDIMSVIAVVEQVLQTHENKGYPFASVELNNGFWINDTLKMELLVDPSLYITYDSIDMNPKDVMSQNFVAKYLGIRYGEAYSEQTVSKVSRKIQNLNFINLKQANVSYELKKAKLHLEIERRRTNNFDGILGMVPAGDEEEGVVFTGEVNLALQNLFKSAKSFQFHWQRLRPESQLLDTKYRHPLLLGTPLNLNLAFYQLKQDSTFSNRLLEAGFDYFITPYLNMRLNYIDKLANELEGISTATADFEIKQYEIGSTIRKFDDPFFPREGFFLETNFGVGIKTVNSDEVGNSDPTQYDITTKGQVLKTVNSHLVFGLLAHGGKLINDQLFLNDLYRLGGLRSVRGFNEGEFFASSFVQSTFEMRWYLNQESYLLTFYDQAFLEEDRIGFRSFDRPSALGFGMRVSTKNGNILVLYGLGKRIGQSYSFDSSKIHFGYTSLF